ncbi:MAG: bis(5'-nucleosyl)-tetraphosphatase (symmetrical) YqeK [Eggerthellaceae bacterium]|nr:bis(5'-nucleosyl)-tetraphosphatase (symmetrical) YqeK [Eggerthellaceae bacterium]
MGVADMCEQLAEVYGVDKAKARLAGLLHDWDKGMDDDGARQRAIDLGMEDEIDPYILEVMPYVLHGITAARALGREYPEIPADVLQAIDRHTTAADDMTPLDMVLYVADAIEPGRMFGRIDELRALVGKVTLEELYYHTYEYWVFLLLERRKPLHPDTIRIWNANVSRLRRYAGRKKTQ